ncbi:MAG TPA: hypothetical protein VF085_06655 [Solirubrobacterales bacterium]
MASEKTLVIENLFLERHDPATGDLTDDMVTLEQVSAAIRKWGGALSDRNPANFMKDIVRSPTRNDVFPDSVVVAGWSARQDPGEGRCFRFVRLPPGQTTAFLTTYPDPTLVKNPHPVQSLSLPPASRTFGRPHETWLTHVVTNLAVVHTHLALNSPLELLGLELLQSNVELGKAEVDAIYLGTIIGGAHFLVSCEMKGPREVLDEDQIERGAGRVAETSGGASVVPMGVKALDGGLVWIVEFDTVFPPLDKVSEGVYRLTPPVQGVG